MSMLVAWSKTNTTKISLRYNHQTLKAPRDTVFLKRRLLILACSEKNSFSGLSPKFDIFVSNCYKFNLVQCLVDRAYKLCSSYKGFSFELDFLKRYFSRNNFPLTFIESYYRINYTPYSFPLQQCSRYGKTPLNVKIYFISYDQNIYIKKQLRAIISEVYHY